MPVRIEATIALLPFVLAAACASAHGPRQQFTGCWYFEQDGVRQLPWGIRLTDSPADEWPQLREVEEARVASTLTAGGERDHPFGFWAPLERDSIRVGYPAGGGMMLRLELGEDTLTGTAHALGDAVAPGETGNRPARAVRLTFAACPEV